MKVDKHISELLYLHDCVIVPKLGGFVANYSSAKIHPTQHTFSPPSKNIVFNKNLITNDGLLANNIVNTEKKSYTAAMDTINQFVSITNNQIKKGEKVNIKNVGTLHLDVERNIQFSPADTNFLPEAFGLPEFQSPAIKYDSAGKRLGKEFKDRDAIPLEKRKITIKRIAIAAVLLPFIIAMIWVPLKTDLLTNINYSNLNPFSAEDSTEIIVQKNKEVKIVNKVEAPIANNADDTPLSTENEELIEERIISTATPEETVANDSEENSINDHIVKDVEAVATRVETAPVIQSSNLKFHLITGCFQIESNAINFAEDLNSQNIPASIIGKRNGLFVVSCGDYSTRQEAVDNLKPLKSHRPDAWLLKK